LIGRRGIIDAIQKRFKNKIIGINMEREHFEEMKSC